MSFLELRKRELNPKDDPCSSNIEQVTEIFVDQGMIKSRNQKLFKYQYLSEFLRYGPEFLHVIINLVGFKFFFLQDGVSRHSFINFKGRAKITPRRI